MQRHRLFKKNSPIQFDGEKNPTERIFKQYLTFKVELRLANFSDFQVISTAKWALPTSGLTNITLVEGTSGSIRSTNFPMDYPPLRTQTTHILGPKGTKIRLRFQASSTRYTF